MARGDKKQRDARTAAPAELAAPPREGLIAGTWKMVDPSRLGVVGRLHGPQ